MDSKLYCYRHPSTETALRCGNCERPICVRCVVQHPVGIRCPECARPTKIPTFDVTPVYYARAVAAAVGIGVIGVLGLLLVNALLMPLGPVAFYLRWLALVGVGYLMGSGMNLAVSRKRSRGLQWIAGIAVVVVFLVVAPFLGLSLNGLFGLLALAAAVYVPVMQLRI
ncbi:MAG: hypothetical protein EXR53_00570 [Dehalococcoidia bacterium]|nr:hypothetical protein [Dehalococcoidia bacterium]